MNYRYRLAPVILLLLISANAVQAHTLAECRFSYRNEYGTGVRMSDLRSAYLIRCGAVRYDPRDVSPESVRQQLQRHFDVVLALLSAATPTSVEMAAHRLERSSGTQWSESQRNRVARRLLFNRCAQMLRLKAYRDRGRFPQHEGQASAATPIFIDNHDTACAVGHLMRLSGCQSKVASIQNSNNLVYIPDITTGPVADWVLTSGLTVEEAALIQPSYPNFPSNLPPIPIEAVKPLEAGRSIVFDDLRFSNFQFYRDGAAAPSVNANVTHSFCTPYACSILPRIEDYDGHVAHIGWFEVLPEGFDGFERVVVQFDVETVLPTQRIARSPQGSTLYTGWNQLVFGQRNEISLFADNSGEEVFIHDLPEWEYGTTDILPILRFNGSAMPMNAEVLIGIFDPNETRPVRSMTVVTELLLRDGQPYQAQRLHFDVVAVPEPATIVLLAAVLVAIGGGRSRKSGMSRQRRGRVSDAKRRALWL